MALNIIDFSEGIRPEEIQENFNYLQDQIERERLNIGGSGIASGLEIEIKVSDDQFAIQVSDGTIVNNDGEEVYIYGGLIDIEPPILSNFQEPLVLTEDRTVTLKYSPYALNRRTPAQYLANYSPELSGIKINYRNSINRDDYIRVSDIANKTLTVTGALSRELTVTYKYTAKRIDILYIDDNNNIKVSQGSITSTTPSINAIPNDAAYLIAYLEINHGYKDTEDSVPKAYITIKNDLRNVRNLYTSSDGTLYICNVPFDDLQIIHMEEPMDPKPNTLWLNLANNTLYCWRNICAHRKA